MKKRSERIDVVVELAQREEDAAAEQFSAAKNALAQAETQLQDLQNYYQGYVSRFGAQTQNVKASDLAKSRSFLQQLAAALDAHLQQINALQQQLQLKRQFWHRLHLKTQSLMDLQQRYRREEAEELDRKDQKQLDEWVSQRRASSDEGCS